MLIEPTREKLKTLRLDAMAKAWEEQGGRPDIQGLSFDERLGLLVDAECLARENKRLARNLKEAKLKSSEACIENLEYSARRDLDKALVRTLATCQWIKEHQNVLITGATGVGKTYLACALAQQACRKGFRVVYRRASRLNEELALAHADGSYARVLAAFARANVLVIDDWGLGTLREQERHDLLEILEDRYGSGSTIITSQLPISSWHDYLGEPTIADAILDRLVHNAHRFTLRGPSKRKEEKAET